MRTATALLKTKLVITGLKEITIPVQYTMLEYFGYGRTDRYATKVINSYRLTMNRILILQNKRLFY